MSDSFKKPFGDSSPGGSSSGTTSAPPGIDYPSRVLGALRLVVRDVLGQVADLGLPGEHHFYISFAPDHPGVGLSDALRAQHPEEMTIVIQHDYRDLEVDDVGFDVTLRFGGIPQSVRVPFEAMTAFFDPAVHFMLRFEPEVDGEPMEIDRDSSESDAEAVDSESNTGELTEPAAGPRRVPTEVLREADALSRASSKSPSKESSPAGEVVSFEAFRRK